MAGKSGKIVGFLFFAPLVLAAAFAVFLAVADFTIPSDYAVKETAKGPDKVETALSNAVERVKSKGFMLSEVKITRPMDKDNVFIVTCRGVDRKAFADRYGSK